MGEIRMNTDKSTLKELRIGEKTAQLPIIQGGMGVGISRSSLAGAVAREGGVGVISTAQIGYDEEGFEQDQAKCNRIAIGKHVKKAKEIAGGRGLVGVNIMVALKHYEEHVRESVKAGADVIISGAGLPMDLPKLVSEKSGTKIAPIVSSRRAANLILKMWAHRYDRTADFIVIEGPKAGGHLGFHEEQLETYGIDAGAEDYVKCRTSYEKEIIAIMQVIHTFSEKYGKKIPVAMGGGIHDSESAARAFSLGADAIQVATRFVTTEECDADIRYKEAYLNARKEDIVIVKSPVGMPGRAILNPFMKKVKELGRIAPAHCFQCLKHCNPGTTPYCITQALINAAKGKIDDALLFCGAYAYQATHLETVKEVIDSLIPERV